RETVAAAPPHRGSKTITERLAVADRKTGPFTQTKIVSRTVVLSLFRFLSFAFPKILPDQKRAASQTRCGTRLRRRRIHPRLSRRSSASRDGSRFSRIRRPHLRAQPSCHRSRAHPHAPIRRATDE